MLKISGFLKVVRNKYILSLIVFAVWILFFDRNDLITQWDRKQELQKLETSVSFYEKEIASTKRDLTDLNSKPVILEKFAREKFYLKRPNEDVVIVNDTSIKKN